MKREPVENAKKRYKEITNLIKGDDIANSLLKDLANSAANYIEIVANRTAVIDIQELRNEQQSLINHLNSRKIANHDALISNLVEFNKYLSDHYGNHAPIGGIYTLDPISISNNVADWAQYFANGVREINGELI